MGISAKRRTSRVVGVCTLYGIFILDTLGKFRPFGTDTRILVQKFWDKDRAPTRTAHTTSQSACTKVRNEGSTTLSKLNQSPRGRRASRPRSQLASPKLSKMPVHRSPPNLSVRPAPAVRPAMAAEERCCGGSCRNVGTNTQTDVLMLTKVPVWQRRKQNPKVLRKRPLSKTSILKKLHGCLKSGILGLL